MAMVLHLFYSNLSDAQADTPNFSAALTNFVGDGFGVGLFREH
jgi:hypothetical protein